MPQLTIGMYGTEFQLGRNPFGLRCGQMHVADDRIVHNGGWYNAHGEQLGWGDLSPKDFLRISRELEDSELFIVLSEWNAFGNFVTEPSAVTGMEDVAEKCRYIIGKDRLNLVDDYACSKQGPREVLRRDLLFTLMTRKEAKKLLAPRWRPLQAMVEFFAAYFR